MVLTKLYWVLGSEIMQYEEILTLSSDTLFSCSTFIHYTSLATRPRNCLGYGYTPHALPYNHPSSALQTFSYAPGTQSGWQFLEQFPTTQNLFRFVA